jgi:hypothetical protein
VFGGRPVILSVIQNEEGSISVLFSLEDGDSWTDVTGRSGFDGKDDGMRIGGSNGRRRRARPNEVLTRELLTRAGTMSSSRAFSIIS